MRSSMITLNNTRSRPRDTAPAHVQMAVRMLVSVNATNGTKSCTTLPTSRKSTPKLESPWCSNNALLLLLTRYLALMNAVQSAGATKTTVWTTWFMQTTRSDSNSWSNELKSSRIQIILPRAKLKRNQVTIKVIRKNRTALIKRLFTCGVSSPWRIFQLGPSWWSTTVKSWLKSRGTCEEPITTRTAFPICLTWMILYQRRNAKWQFNGLISMSSSHCA